MKAPSLAAIAVIVAVVLLALSAGRPASAANSITVNPAQPTTETGVYFTVTTGGGNRDYASVDVRCRGQADDVIYETILTVAVEPKSSGDSQTIYPPASSCTADLVKLMQIGKARVLATASFEVGAAP